MTDVRNAQDLCIRIADVLHSGDWRGLDALAQQLDDLCHSLATRDPGSLVDLRLAAERTAQMLAAAHKGVEQAQALLARMHGQGTFVTYTSTGASVEIAPESRGTLVHRA
jgi:hypothetical protein